MINEDELEQLAIQWFRDAGWSYAHGPDIAPEGVAQERSEFRGAILKDRLSSAITRLNPKLLSGDLNVPAAQAQTTDVLT